MSSTLIDLTRLEARILGRQAGMHWYTLVIEPGAWRRVGDRADEMGYATYCPLGKFAPHVGRGARSSTLCRSSFVERPLMPGYIFVDMPGERRFDLFQASGEGEDGVRGSRGFIAIDGSPVAVHEAVIEDMRLREKNGEFDLTGLTEDGRHRVPKWAKRSSVVEFIEGPFAGCFGTVVKAVSATMIEIAMTIFGRSSNARVPLDWVRLAR